MKTEAIQFAFKRAGAVYPPPLKNMPPGLPETQCAQQRGIVAGNHEPI
jgi:hypothetical protein